MSYNYVFRYTKISIQEQKYARRRNNYEQLGNIYFGVSKYSRILKLKFFIWKTKLCNQSNIKIGVAIINKLDFVSLTNIIHTNK